MKTVMSALVIFMVMGACVFFLGFAQDNTERVEMSPFEKLEEATLHLKEAREAFIKAQMLTKEAMDAIAARNRVDICDVCSRCCECLGCCNLPQCGCTEDCIKVSKQLEEYIEKMPILVEILKEIRPK